MTFSQAEAGVRCEWGEAGVRTLAPVCDAIIIIDVLSFSTCVDIAVSRGALVYPHDLYDQSAHDYATSLGAELAGAGRYTLSPSSLLDIPDGTRLVLPSPNGAALSCLTGATPTFCGCLRNAATAARAAATCGATIGVVPAGERWPDGSLRPSLEDWLAAGAIIRHLPGTWSGEARSAVAAFNEAEAVLQKRIMACGSGLELIERGRSHDVEIAVQLNSSQSAPRLLDGAYRSEA